MLAISSFLTFRLVDGFLRDHDKTVREAAAVGLAQSGAHGELLLIEAVLKDANPVIRAAASYVCVDVYVYLVVCIVLVHMLTLLCLSVLVCECV